MGKSDRVVPVCTPVAVPARLRLWAADLAVRHNPANAPSRDPDDRLAFGTRPSPDFLAAATNKIWRTDVLTVGFLDSTPPGLRDRILLYMNRWSTRGGRLRFAYSTQSPVIRITREGYAYASYIGTDALAIPEGEATFWLGQWVASMPEAEWLRVVPHESGHARSYEHGHLRRDQIRKLVPERVIARMRREQGWSRELVIQQCLTPLEETAIWASKTDDSDSIMTYQYPGSDTVDGRPIPGGADINVDDYVWDRRVYGAPEGGDDEDGDGDEPPAPEPPPSPPPGVLPLLIGGDAVEVDLSPLVPVRLGVQVPGPGTLALTIVVEKAGSLFGWLDPTVAVVAPSGTRTPVYVPNRKARLGFQAGGLYVLEVLYGLPRRASVRVAKVAGRGGASMGPRASVGK